jgi:hypothetical protein
VLVSRLFGSLVTLLAVAAAGQEPRVLFVAEGQSGSVWVNVTLTELRIAEPYLPMMVAVQNLGGDNVVIDRGALRLIGQDGIRHPVADLREVRSGYSRLRLDRRIASSAGIPVDVWYRQGRLRESNFFPDVGGGGGVVIDEVVLRRSDALVDLFYFQTPAGLASGSPFVLEVAPEGWEAPVRLGLTLK